MPVGSGQAPKRSDQRRRRNKVDIDKVDMVGDVPVPELGIDNPHPIVADFYESLKKSGQAKWYEPSDWQRARLTMHLLDGLLKSGGRPSSTLYAALQQDLGALLTTEADRRRLHMEVERNTGDDGAEKAKVARMAEYRQAAKSHTSFSQ